MITHICMVDNCDIKLWMYKKYTAIYMYLERERKRQRESGGVVGWW